MSVRTQRNSLPLLCMNFKVPGYPDYYFRDDFDDDIRDPLWTDTPNNDRTITELNRVLTLAVAATKNGNWWQPNIDNAPIAIISPTADALTITTKLNSYTVTDQTNAGLIIGNTLSIPDAAGTYCYSWMRARSVAGGINGLEVINLGVIGSQAVNIVTTLPVWLRIRATAQSAPNTIYFDYSTDSINWINIHSITNFNWTFVGLHAKNWGAFAAIAAPFEFFELENLTEQECLAPIDTRGPTVFYDGRIKQMSTLKRAIDDKTGLFQVADMSVTLANEDKHYSQKMANRILKNQLATLYHALTEEPEANKIEIIKLIVDDHSMKGPDFIVKLKDITQKYFTKKIPENICTSDDFPDIHPDYEGWCMPEILGNAVLTTAYEHPGAIEAVYVDTNPPTPPGEPFRCLASAGTVTVNEVWIGEDPAVPKTEGVHYDITYLGGRTYIDFKVGQDPGDDTVTFNAHGYSAPAVPAWDSPNGYIQNLAYIIEYFLRFIMDVPATLVNSASFDTLATLYEDMAVDQNCYLILQDRMDAMEILRQLLFTGGAKGYMALDGRFTVGRKDICNWEIASNEYHIFDQIDLFDSPDRQWNLTSAINTINAEYGLIPWQNLYKGAKSEYAENRFGADMEDDIRDRESDRGRRR